MDTVYTKREDAGKALLGLLGMAMNRTEPVSIGQYKGFDLQIAYFAMDKMYLAYLVGSGINPVQLGADAVGNTVRLDNSMSVAQFRKWIETGSIPKSVLEKKKKESEKVCPLCGGALVLRVAKFGPKPGSRFYGCKNFPDCHYTEPYEEEKAKEDN